MRVMVFFDLPVGTKAERHAYSVFRRRLIKMGFLMLQESVYCKLALNAGAAEAIADQVRRSKPEQGLIHMLTVTERQFAKMEILLGEERSEVIDSDERLVVL